MPDNSIEACPPDSDQPARKALHAIRPYNCRVVSENPPRRKLRPPEPLKVHDRVSTHISDRSRGRYKN